ncbi:lantibiotic dehydratase [Acrocarpospora sp. B8E8]|uniref:lantibiotic dehydratase n=1 Tax=Acrocarpospora sp. B8E8 TaxID=3153572 RepID=UPI00325C869F
MRTPGFQRVGGATLRASVFDVETVMVPPWPGGDLGLDEDTVAGQWREWVRQVWRLPSIADAITVASPTVAARVQAVLGGRQIACEPVRRLARTLARYLVRMRGRATPFGLFAGVALVQFTNLPPADTIIGHSHVRVRADAAWLAEMIVCLEAVSAIRRRLPVVANDCTVLRGDRLVVTWQPRATAGPGSAAEISVRHSPLLDVIADAARIPIVVNALLDKLAADLPDVPDTAIDDMLATLIRSGVLISSLRPSSTSSDGLAHVLTELDTHAADVLAEMPLVDDLREIHARLTTAARRSWAATVTVGARMRRLALSVAQPLTVDLRFDRAPGLPEEVAAEAQTAAEALLRLVPDPDGHAGWRAFHAMFLDTYGVGSLVPVRLLTDSAAGLGVPAHAAGPGAGLTRRDEHLLALAQQTALDGAWEIVFDDCTIDRLSGNATRQPAPHMELCVDVRAADSAALAQGAFTLAVLGIGRSAVAMTGRFLDVLPPADRLAMLKEYADLPVAVQDAIAAQLSFPPKQGRTANVATAPPVLPAMITMAEYPHTTEGRAVDCIGLDDLAVTADAGQFYLVSLSRRRIIEPILANATAPHTWPPIVRLLLGLARARTAAVPMFTWGAAECLPFLPRVRYRRTIVSPARWRIPDGTLPGAAASDDVWNQAVATVRDRLSVPRWVSVGTDDRLLRLDLDEPMDLAVLRAHVNGSAGDLVVREAATPDDYGWLNGRAHELVVPLASTAPPASPPAIVTQPCLPPPVARDHVDLPGTQVLFAKLYGPADAADTVVTCHLPDLLSACGRPPVWWFLRYRDLRGRQPDPAPHLRVRLRLADASAYGQAVTALGVWATGLRQRGLIGDLVLDTHVPEFARFGGGAALAAAEALFAADSASAVAQLSFLAAESVHPALSSRALTAASLADLVCAVTGDTTTGMRWLIDHAAPTTRVPQTRTDPGRRGHQDVVRQAIAFLDPMHRGDSPPGAITRSDEVLTAWRTRRHAAATYAQLLARDPAAAHVSADAALRALLHLHHVRAHGVDRDCEQRCHRLARAVALAWTGRPTPSPARSR